MHKYAIIVAGGSGMRMGGEIPKQFQLLGSKPLLWHTLHAFTTAYAEVQIVLVLPESHMKRGEDIAAQFPETRIRLVAGGETRFHSVRNGLRMVDAHALVFIHDGVRCLVSPQLIRHCAGQALEKGNAIPAMTATDTIRLIKEKSNEMIDRSKVMLIQTPQTFLSNPIKEAYEQEYLESFTDDASVAEKMGMEIHLIAGESTNIKITRPMDMIIAEWILANRNNE